MDQRAGVVVKQTLTSHCDHAARQRCDCANVNVWRQPVHHLPLELELAAAVAFALAAAAAFAFDLVRDAMGAALGTEQTAHINFGISATVLTTLSTPRHTFDTSKVLPFFKHEAPLRTMQPVAWWPAKALTRGVSRSAPDHRRGP